MVSSFILLFFALCMNTEHLGIWQYRNEAWEWIEKFRKFLIHINSFNSFLDSSEEEGVEI